MLKRMSILKKNTVMKTIQLIALVLVMSAGMFSSSKGYCQGNVSGDTIKSMLIKDFERAKAYTQDYMKAMPASKYNFKAMDSVRTFAQQLLHLSQAFSFFVAIANGQKPDFTAPQLEKTASAQSADSVMYYVNRGYDVAINGLKSLNSSDLMQPATFTADKPYTATRLGWFMKAFEHQTHHRGQTTIYLRLAGIKPPDERLF
jgi:uncharacterized damage-inducible protein DinB